MTIGVVWPGVSLTGVAYRRHTSDRGGGHLVAAGRGQKRRAGRRDSDCGSRPVVADSHRDSVREHGWTLRWQYTGNVTTLDQQHRALIVAGWVVVNDRIRADCRHRLEPPATARDGERSSSRWGILGGRCAVIRRVCESDRRRAGDRALSAKRKRLQWICNGRRRTIRRHVTGPSPSAFITRRQSRVARAIRTAGDQPPPRSGGRSSGGSPRASSTASQNRADGCVKRQHTGETLADWKRRNDPDRPRSG